MADEPMTIEQAQTLLGLQKSQIEQARKAYFRLAEIRGAELVIHQNHSLEQAKNYRDTELQGLDGQLSALIPSDLLRVEQDDPPPEEWHDPAAEDYQPDEIEPETPAELDPKDGA